MAVDRFSKERFEAALPRIGEDGVAFRRFVRFEGNQFIYRYQITSTVFLTIYSSIDSTGLARETAEDSIRFTITDVNGSPLSNKLQTWVTRVKGWEARVVLMFERMLVMAKIAGTPCHCGQSTRKVFIVKKDGPNKGRLFVNCPACGQFDWLTEPKEARRVA